MGMGKLSLKNRPKLLSLKQAVASVGQCELMYTYDKLFSEHNHTVAQILLTADDVNNKVRCKNYTNTINKLFELGVLPIINENDTVATSELLIGDNDTLAATVAKTVNADILILLSDIDGLYTADPSKNKKAKLIKEIKEITPDIEALAGGSGSKVGTGGMVTKINAAKIVNAAGCDMIIANGKTPELLYDIIEGKSVGTRFLGVKK